MVDRVLEVEQIAIPIESIYRLSVAQYHALIDAGILMDGDPVELLEGWLVEKMTKNWSHICATRKINSTFLKLLPRGWFVMTQDPVTLATSEPEPDVMVVRGNEDDYEDKPTEKDTVLIVEVSDATLRLDRVMKVRIYARAGIPVYWIVNLVDRQIEVFTEPKDGNYQKQQIYPETSTIPVVIDQVQVAELAVSDLLP